MAQVREISDSRLISPEFVMINIPSTSFLQCVGILLLLSLVAMSKVELKKLLWFTLDRRINERITSWWCCSHNQHVLFLDCVSCLKMLLLCMRCAVRHSTCHDASFRFDLNIASACYIYQPQVELGMMHRIVLKSSK